MKSLIQLASAMGGVFLVSCSTPFPEPLSSGGSTESRNRALAILEGTVRAHGGDLYREVSGLEVEFAGEWSLVADRIQPVLVDASFRETSREKYDFSKRVVSQEHRGGDGVKEVIRDYGRRSVEITRNGVADEAKDAKQTAAIVADAYRMFVTAPFYFYDRVREGEARVALLKPVEEDGQKFDRIWFRLRPGFGEAAQDRAVLWINRTDDRVYRVEFTIDGYEPTVGANVWVTYDGFRTESGYTFPDRYVEDVKAPFKFHAHRWRTVGLRVLP